MCKGKATPDLITAFNCLLTRKKHTKSCGDDKVVKAYTTFAKHGAKADDYDLVASRCLLTGGSGQKDSRRCMWDDYGRATTRMIKNSQDYTKSQRTVGKC